MTRKLVAEFIGTFWLVTAIFGSALMAAGIPDVGIGWFGVSFAAGLAVLGMAYAVGGISGGHFNPAVTLGLALSGRTGWNDLIPYWIAQVLGAIAAMLIVWLVAAGATGFAGFGTFASNGYAELSPGGYNLISALVVEIVLTAGFLIVILGSTSSSAPAGFAPLTIGLTLAVAHFVAIPVTNASINPARSIASALGAGLNGNWAPAGQVWLFMVAPLAGAALGGLIWKYLLSPGESPAGVGRD
jgi:aquaporin Z